MVKGRKPIAAEIKERQGSFRNDPGRRKPDAPGADGLPPEMPEYFNDDECRKWMELEDDLNRNGILSTDCREIMIAYCTAYGGWMRARRSIEKTGIVLKMHDKNGQQYYKRNPFSVELHKYRDEMNRLLPEFGLTPASRQKLVSFKEEEVNPVLELMGRYQGQN